MKNLADKKILFIICGGIAAYKSLELIRLFRKNKASIRTILTRSAKKFVTPLSIASLSQGKVYEDLFNIENELEMDHIALSRWADVIVVAPATANTISKLASGNAEDLASTVILASNKQVYLAPAMNVRMWEHQSNKENIKKIKDFNYKLIGPNIGDMACGEYGEGKMSEPLEIVKKISDHFQKIKNNKKLKAIVTAGPTREYIDPVRFISNESSGKQGYEIANSLNNNGFETTLISGPSNLKISPEINLIKVDSAQAMYEATIGNLPADIAIFTAAVADWKIKNYQKNKIKNKDNLNLDLEKNVDILKHVSNHNSLRPKLVIGFSAETENIERNSVNKLKDKNCDWIISNDVSDKTIGFGSDYNEVTIFYKNKQSEIISKMKKTLLADAIVERAVAALN